MNNLPPFKSVCVAGRAPGTRLIVLGAVHGNETCGTRGIERALADLDRGALRLVPAASPSCRWPTRWPMPSGRRTGERNLNRALQPTAAPREFEDHVANWLCPLLAAHEVLLDLHSFQGTAPPFVMVGPTDNDGALEPFALAAREEALVRCLGVTRAVDGWLGTYADGVARRRRLAEADGLAGTLELDARYGVGTTEYMRSVGGCALTLECGAARRSRPRSRWPTARSATRWPTSGSATSRRPRRPPRSRRCR